MPLQDLQVKLQKTAEITDLEGNKQGTTSQILMFRSKNKSTIDGEMTASKVNITFLVVINKEIRCAWCI